MPSVTNGVVIERSTYWPRGIDGGQPGVLESNFESLTVQSSNVSVVGWVVDTSLPGGGVAAVRVDVTVDVVNVGSFVASVPRPDLVKAKVAPNPDHGFDATLPNDVAKMLQSGKHVVDVWAVGSPLCLGPVRVVGSPICTCDGVVCDC